MTPLQRVTIRGTKWEVDPSGEEVLHADEPHALVMAAGYLKFKLGADSSEAIYFRGQRELYGSLVPSLYRGFKTQNVQDKRNRAVAEVVSSFREAGGKIFKGFGDYAHEPLLQHYGINTSWIDVVDNIWVALWFACYKAMSAGGNHQYLHFEKRDPDADDFAYILLVAADVVRRSRKKPGYYFGDNTELVDLRVATPSVFLRPHAQHGLVLRRRGSGLEQRSMDYGQQIRGIIRVDLRKALRWMGEGEMVGIHSLFPPPYYDNGYQILLSCGITPEKEIGAIGHVGA